MLDERARDREVRIIDRPGCESGGCAPKLGLSTHERESYGEGLASRTDPESFATPRRFIPAHLHASFFLQTPPRGDTLALRYPSPPLGRDFHPPAAEHARRTTKNPLPDDRGEGF